MKTVSSIAIATGLLFAITQVTVAQDQSPPPAASSEAPANPAMKSPDDTASARLAKGHNSFAKSEALGVRGVSLERSVLLTILG